MEYVLLIRQMIVIKKNTIQMTDVAPSNTDSTPKTVTLAKEHLISGLSLVNRTLDNSGFAFTKLVIQNQNISDAAILKAFQHLRHLVIK